MCSCSSIVEKRQKKKKKIQCALILYFDKIDK